MSPTNFQPNRTKSNARLNLLQIFEQYVYAILAGGFIFPVPEKLVLFFVSGDPIKEIFQGEQSTATSWSIAFQPTEDIQVVMFLYLRAHRNRHLSVDKECVWMSIKR